MLFYKGELTFEGCIGLKKQGFVVPLYKCDKKITCESYRGRKGRKRCPGKLLLNEKSCGWNKITETNCIMISVNEPDRFIPQHIVPII